MSGADVRKLAAGQLPFSKNQRSIAPLIVARQWRSTVAFDVSVATETRGTTIIAMIPTIVTTASNSNKRSRCVVVATARSSFGPLNAAAALVRRQLARRQSALSSLDASWC